MDLVLPIYVALCAGVGFFGRDRKLGFWGYVLVSLLFSPLIGAIVVAASAPRAPSS
ncbi:hypothetical protein [Actomonas aquatica]|uniref:Uncharacterized protein n=1 Tax=Actomonas aquatica TaxID=2866162 RepID=A0ABZ1CDU6_9BACT|nr:hypothetical protein [Opitutus sp. WL0086]WRQ89734.1 hypothetical protein K1X11_009970 [Opitutus sp. WL0086]